MANNGQTYGDKLILGGLKMWKEVKSGAKKQFKSDISKVKNTLKRKKKKDSPKFTTTRTKAINTGLNKAGIDWDTDKPSRRK